MKYASAHDFECDSFFVKHLYNQHGETQFRSVIPDRYRLFHIAQFIYDMQVNAIKLSKSLFMN